MIGCLGTLYFEVENELKFCNLEARLVLPMVVNIVSRSEVLFLQFHGKVDYSSFTVETIHSSLTLCKLATLVGAEHLPGPGRRILAKVLKC